jgi:hyperosmotically inducible periplasmic protein
MKIKLAATCILAGALLLPVAGYGADNDTNRSSPKTFVKDSVITSKIKAELAEEKLSSLVKISVDTTDKGMVVLSGSARNQAAIDKAVSIATAVKGVTSVENNIKVVADK